MARVRKLGYGEGSVYPLPAGGFMGELRIQGRRRRVTGATKSEVIAKLDELRSATADGLPLGDNTRLGPWLEWWLNTVVAEKDPNTLANYQWAVGHLAPLHSRPLRELTPQEVEDLFARKHLGRNSLMRIRSCLGAALEEAERRDMIGRNVARLAHLPAKAAPPRRGRSLTPEQARTLLDAAKGDRLEALVLVAFTMGLRPGEVLGLTWSEVDLDANTLAVSKALKRRPGGGVLGTPKASSDRTLGIPPALVATLKAQQVAQKAERLAAPVWEDHDLVFPNAIGRPMDPSNLRREFDRLTRDAALGHWTLNELRHSAASFLVAAGKPLDEVQDFMGHKTLRMLSEVYGHRIRPVVDVTDAQARMLGG
jgi:integrase